MRRITIASLLAAVLVMCSSPSSSGGRPSVVATTTVLADLAAQVAGPDATVDALAPAGASIEDFAPKPEDAKRIANARVILVNGLALDRWVEPLLRNASKDARVVTLSDDLPRLGLGESANPDINANGNPHYWFDVKYAKVYVERIRDVLVTADPAHSAGYRSRATSYLADLDRLDAEIRAKVTQIPPARRKLVTSHDAFPYYAAAYGLSVVGFTQPEEGKEPSPAELAALVGANGAGKSTLLKVIVGLLSPSTGTVRVLGTEPHLAAPHIAYLPQAEELRWDYPLRVDDVVAMGRIGRKGPLLEGAQR